MNNNLTLVWADEFQIPVLRQAFSVGCNFPTTKSLRLRLLNMQQTKRLKRKHGIAFILMLSCFFVFTLGQFIPIYFININFRQTFYLAVLGVILITVTLTTFKFTNRKYKSKLVVGFISVFVGIATSLLFGFLFIFLSLAIWTEAATYYVNKDNPKVKIVSRYLNLGAFGGGTEPADYEVVLQRPILNLFNMQTSIDTTSIDKQRWIKYK